MSAAAQGWLGSTTINAVCFQDEPELLHGGVVRGARLGGPGRRTAVGAAGGKRGRHLPPQVVGAAALPQQPRHARRQVPHPDLVMRHSFLHYNILVYNCSKTSRALDGEKRALLPLTA